jgi:hypothetical protein
MVKNTTQITTSAIDALSTVEVWSTIEAWRITDVSKLSPESVPKNRAGAKERKIRKTANAIRNPSRTVLNFEVDMLSRLKYEDSTFSTSTLNRLAWAESSTSISKPRDIRGSDFTNLLDIAR